MTLQGIEALIKNCPEDLTAGNYIQKCEEIRAWDFYALNYNNIACIFENFLRLRKAWSAARELISK